MKISLEKIDKSEFNFKNYEKINVENFINFCSSASNEEWNKFTFRQESFDVHKKTKTIPLIFDKSFDYNIFFYENFEKLENELTEIENHIKKYIDKDFYMIRAILVNLPKGQVIEKHIDSGNALSSSKRFHIPITTNEHCIFYVGNDFINMKVGEVWEISNTNKEHWVENFGENDRIHLIVDFAKILNT